MKEVLLGDICTLKSGGTPDRAKKDFYGGKISWAKISDIEKASGDLIFSTEETISEPGLENIGNRIFPKGTLLLAMYGSVGKVAITGTEMATNQAIIGILPKKKNAIDLNYLKHWLISQKEVLLNKARGGTLKNISATIVKNLKIPLPPIDKQIQIAFILDTAEQIRRAREWSLVALTAFRVTYFLETFGDPANNPKNWKMTTLSKLTNFMTSGSRGWAKYYSDKGGLFLRIQNVGQNRLLLDDPTYVNPPDDAEAKRTKVQAKDLLISVTADLGRTAVIPEDFGTAYINQHLVLVRLKTKEVNPYFAASYITSDRNIQVKNLSKGGVKAGLNFTDIGAIKIPIVPIELQNHFEKVCLEVAETRRKLEEYLEANEKLQKSLLQKAFEGTLEINEKEWKRLDTEGWVKNYIETGSPTPKPPEVEYFPLPIENIIFETEGKKTEYSNIGNMLTEVKNYVTNAFGKQGYFTFEELETVLFEKTQLTFAYSDLKDYVFKELDNKDGWFEQDFLLDDERDKSKGTDDSRIIFRIKEQESPK